MANVSEAALATAANVRAEAARLPVSVEELGIWLGVSRNSASQRLNGHIAFRLDELRTLADKFGVPLAVLIGDPS